MRLYINDVAVRDGFQIEKAFVPTATKVELVNQLARTGLHKIEVTSFVSAKAVPALADAGEVLARIDRVPGVVYVALVPNVRGVLNATAAARRPDEVNGVVSASETHNRANINRTHEQSLAELPAMVKAAHEAGMKITMSLSTTFGCPF
jgi:hydroxymethylglutaryl-CoA lyase